MKFGLMVVIALALGSLAAHFLMQDNGYVLLSFRGYSIEMSIPVLIFVLFVAYLLVRLAVGIWHAPRRIGEAAARSRETRAGNQIEQGFVALSEGKLARGERLLTRSARTSNAPLLQYLAAARTAQMQGDRERRDGWLKMAYEQNEDAANAVLLVQADLQMEDGELERARASLNRIRDTQPDHPEALRMLARLFRREQDWPALAALLPTLRRRGNVARNRLDAWTVEAWSALLAENDLDRPRIETLWEQLPRALRRDPVLRRARIAALARSGDTAAADTEIRKALRNDWDSELVLLYGTLDMDDIGAQLKQAEQWLRNRPEDPDLLLTAGRACIRSQLWGKARSYLESSLAIRPSAAAYRELGQLMIQIGDETAATDAFSKGLSLTTGIPGVPRLESTDPAAD